MSEAEVIAQLREALEAATKKLKEQDGYIKDISKLPGFLATVTHILPNNRIVVDNHLLMEKPRDKQFAKLKDGDIIHVSKSGENNVAMVEIIELPTKPVMVMKVAEVLPDGRVFLDGGPGGNLIPLHDRSRIKDIEPGDRLLLGGRGPLDAIAMENMGKDGRSYQLAVETIEVTWDDIGGQSLAKLAMKEAIEYPIIHQSLYKSLGKRPLKGVLLEGPPGVGKTLLAKAAATAIRKLYKGKHSDTAYIYVKGPEVLSKWVGEAESTIRNLFVMAREHKRKHGYPAIIFIDECEAILSKRGSGVSSDMEKTIVPSFLAELDGINDSGAMVLLATNRADRLDSAVIRDGRIDRKVRLSRPNKEESQEIFNIHLKKVPAAAKGIEALAAHAADTLFHDKHALYRLDFGDNKIDYGLGHMSSGAMIAGVVDRATSVLLHDCIAAGAKTAPAMLPDHIERAIVNTREELIHLDHKDEITDFITDLGQGQPRAIARLV